jgi:lysophospholipase L1-like esterase
MTFRWRYVLGRSAMVLLGLLAGFIVVEAALRLFPLPNRFILLEQLGSLWESDDELLLHLKPDLDLAITGHPEFRFTVTTNAEGLRDDPWLEAQDLVAVGDSFTFGFGVDGDEAWPERLEAQTGLQVANLGWAGWSSFVYPAALRRHAVPLGAKTWLWAFFVNDLPESAGAESFILAGGRDFKASAMDGAGLGQDLRFPFNLRTVQLASALLDNDLFLLPDSGSGFLDDGQVRLRYGTYPWDVTDPGREEVQRGWTLTEEALLDAQALAASQGAQLVLLFVPTREHAFWPYLQALMPNKDVTQLDQVDGRLAGFAAEHDIPYFSLLPAFRRAALDGRMVYFPNDGHWNSEGHQLAADEIAVFLEQAGLIP